MENNRAFIEPPVVSSNGKQIGVVWAVERSNSTVTLRAYDADNFGKEILNKDLGHWDDGNVNSDGSLRKLYPFIEPTIVNGKVYVASQSNVHVLYCANEHKIQ